MNILDLIILIFLLFGAFKGYKRGFVLELIAILALFLGVIGGLKLLHWGMDILKANFEINSLILPYITFVLIFIAIIFLVNFIGKAVKKVLDLTLLGSVDNLAGALIGILKWALALSILIWISNSFGIYLPEHFKEKANLYPLVSSFAPTLVGYLTTLFPFIEDLLELIHDFIQSNVP